MVIKSTDTLLDQAIKAFTEAHPLCSEGLPMGEFCVDSQPPPLDQYKDKFDWVPFFYAPSQYHFCKAFDEWYYRSCVPATQAAREDLRDIVKKNDNGDSKKEITDQLSGTLNKTEDACAGIDPDLLRETENKCDTIISLHNKNRWILGLGLLSIAFKVFTFLKIRHAQRSWHNMMAEREKVWGEVRTTYQEKGLWQATNRFLKGMGEVWNARESDFREQVTDINIFFAKLLESAEPEKRAAAVAEWNAIKKQKKLSAEEKFEQFKEVIRRSFANDILGIIDQLEVSLVKELIFQSSRFERLGELLEAGENMEAIILIDELAEPIRRFNEVLELFRKNAGLFNNSSEIAKRINDIKDWSVGISHSLGLLDAAIEYGQDMPSMFEKIKKELARQDLRRVASVVGHASRLAAWKGGLSVEVKDIPDIKLKGGEEIVGLYKAVQLIMETFRKGERAYLYSGAASVQHGGRVVISAEVKDNVLLIRFSGDVLPDILAWRKATAGVSELGWRLDFDINTKEVILKIGTGPAKGLFNDVQRLHFAAVHYGFDKAAEAIRGLLARIENGEASTLNEFLTNDLIPQVEEIYARFESAFYEEILPRIGGYMGELKEALEKKNHELLVEYFEGNITTVLRYAKYLSDDLHGFAAAANILNINSPHLLTTEWQAAAVRFWGIVHDIGNVLGALNLEVDAAIIDGNMEWVKKFNLTKLKGIIETVRFINKKFASSNGVELASDELPEFAIPSPSHVSLFRMVNELVTNAVRNYAQDKKERKILVLGKLAGSISEGKIYIVVADNGVGLDAPKEARPKGIKGSGAGLKIIRTLAEKEGWGFQISSDLSTLDIPEDLRARIQGMSTAAVLVIDISGKPLGGEKPAPLGGYASDKKGPDQALSIGVRQMLGSARNGAALFRQPWLVPAYGASQVYIPSPVLIVP